MEVLETFGKETFFRNILITDYVCNLASTRENLVSNIFLCQNLHTTPSEIPFMET